MKTIKEHFNSLNQVDWDYYKDFSSNKLENPFLTNFPNHTNFIKSFFKRSGKNLVLNLIDLTYDNIEKANHTNSIFFLGILFYKHIFKTKILFKNYNRLGYHEFPFIWFITCLYHDIGLHYEQDKVLIDSVFDLELVKKKLKISNCLLEQKIEGIDKNLFSNVRQYFYYRRIMHKKLDHGIIAGLNLYDKLIKNRIEKEKTKRSNLYWGKDLEKQYALIASTIAMHNIWIPNSETVCDYYKFEMKSLINFKPININKFPLLFLLGLVDTIDPIKTFEKEFSDDYIIRNLKIGFNNNKIVIMNNEKSKLDFSKLINKSSNLKGWLDIHVDINRNKKQLSLTII